MIDGPLPGEQSALHVYDMKERKDHVLVEELESYSLSADGEKVLYKKHEKSPDGTIALRSSMRQCRRARTSPSRKTWISPICACPSYPLKNGCEMFNNAWRLERDLFVNPEMNGVAWQKVHDAYAALLPLVGSREDLTYLIGEMQGELGNSHTYVGGGDDANPNKPVPTALLGVDFALNAASGRYYFAKIYPGDNTRPDYRSPLTEPGINVHEGDYLLAVDGHALKAPTDPIQPVRRSRRRAGGADGGGQSRRKTP